MAADRRTWRRAIVPSESDAAIVALLYELFNEVVVRVSVGGRFVGETIIGASYTSEMEAVFVSHLLSVIFVVIVVFAVIVI